MISTRSADVESMLKQASELMDVEQNYTAQMAKLIRRETGVLIQKYLFEV